MPHTENFRLKTLTFARNFNSKKKIYNNSVHKIRSFAKIRWRQFCARLRVIVVVGVLGLLLLLLLLLSVVLLRDVSEQGDGRGRRLRGLVGRGGGGGGGVVGREQDGSGFDGLRLGPWRRCDRGWGRGLGVIVRRARRVIEVLGSGGGGGRHGRHVFGRRGGGHRVRAAVRHVVDGGRGGLAEVTRTVQRRWVLGRRRAQGLRVRRASGDERFLLLVRRTGGDERLLFVRRQQRRFAVRRHGVAVGRGQRLAVGASRRRFAVGRLRFGGRMDAVAALRHDRVEPVLVVGRVVHCPHRAVRFHDAVRTLNHVALPVLPLALQITRVQVLYAVVEVIVRLTL